MAGLSQHASPGGGPALVGGRRCRRRDRLRGQGDLGARLRPAPRWSVVATLIAARVPGGAAQAPWGAFVEDVLTGAARSAGISFAVALPLFDTARPHPRPPAARAVRPEDRSR